MAPLSFHEYMYTSINFHKKLDPRLAHNVFLAFLGKLKLGYNNNGQSMENIA